MAILLGLFATIAAAATDMPPDAPAPPHNFLQGAAASRGCVGDSDKGEIVVCGDAPYPAHLPDAQYAEKPVRAEAKVLGDDTIKLHGDTTQLGGAKSQRALVTATVPF